MENIDKNNLSEKIEQNSISTIPSNDSSPYMTAETLFDTRQYGEDFLNMADPAALLNVDRYQSDMNKYGPEVFANLTAPEPGLVNVGYNPAKSKIGDLSLSDQLKLAAEQPKQNILPISDPIYSNLKEVNFERYYAHPKYNELGFHPYQNNESYYNANSTKMDDISRAYSQFGKQYFTGLGASINSVIDIFSGEPLRPDYVGAKSMEDAMRIGSTTRGGAFGTLTNLGLSFGYTAGIISSIALEELALAAGSAAITLGSGGTAAPATAAGFLSLTGRNLFRTGRAVVNFFDAARYASAANAVMKSVNNIKTARQLFNVGASAAGRIFAPEVTLAIEKWKTTGNTAQNLFNVTKSHNLFGAAYRDIRQINLALAEGKLEAGMVENRVRENRFQELTASGVKIDGTMLADLNDKAAQAGFTSLMQNTGIIYFSNKLFLRGALRGFRGKTGGVGKYRINPLKDPITGKALKGVYKQKSKYILPQVWNELKVSGFKGAPRVFAGSMMRYGAGGLAEGLQEVSQEAIAATNEGYYGALLREPGGGAKAFYGSFAMSGMKEQISSQGFETFLSGFLMSGLAGPYQQILFKGLPRLYSMRSKNSRKDYADQKEAEDKVIADIIKQSNEGSIGTEADGSTTIETILDPVQLQASLQKNTMDAQNEAELAGDKYEYYNNKYFGDHAGIVSKFENGSINNTLDDIKGFTQMTNEELEEAFPDQGGAIKIREKFDKQRNLIKEYGEAYDRSPEIFKKRYFPEKFAPGRLRNEEKRLQRGYKHMQYIYMFNEGAFKDALERKTKIAEKLSNTPLFGKMAANDVTPLLDKESLQIELDRLDQEIDILQDNIKNQTGLTEIDNKRNKKNLKDKTSRRNKLQAISKVYNNNLTNKGYFDRRKRKSLETPIKNYLKALAISQGTYVDNDAVNAAIDEIIDYATLSQDAFMFNNTIDYLLDPNKMEDLTKRSAEYFKTLGANKNSILTAQIRDMINVEKQNGLINELAKEDIYIDPDEGRRFLETGDINELKTFIFAGKVLKLNQGVLLDDQIYRQKVLPIINTYIELITPAKTVEEQAVEVTEQATEEVEETLKAAGVSDIKIDTAISPMLKAILKKQFIEYQANTFGDLVMNYNDWEQSAGAKAIIQGFQSIQKVWGGGFVTLSPEGNPIESKPSESEILKEVGFQDFLNSRVAKESPVIIDILNELNINMSLFTTTKPAPSKGIIETGVVVDLQERVLDITNRRETTSYALLGKDGNIINDRLKNLIKPGASGTFFNKTEALNNFNKLEEQASDGSTFMFGGKALSRGVRLVDNNGNEFVVNTNFNGSMTTPGIIYLVPAAEFSDNFGKNSAAAKKFGAVPEQDFIGRYDYIQEINLEELDDNYAKLPLDEAIKAWPYRNKNEANDSSQERLNFIISNLTPLEISRLRVVVVPSITNTNTPFYSGPIVEGKIDKLANKYIIEKGNDFSIGIKLVNIPETEKGKGDAVNTRDRIGLLIENAKLTPLEENADGVFAFLPSNQYTFTDGIDPIQMSLDVMKNTMFTNASDYKNNTPKQNLEIVRNNFATAEIFINEIKEKFTSGVVEVEIKDLDKGIKLELFSGFANYTKPVVKTELGNLDTKNEIVVLDVDKITGIPTYITNLKEEGAEEQLIKEIESQLKAQGILDKDGVFITDTTNRYNVVVQDVSGKYTVATASPKSQSTADLNLILLEYINEAIAVLDSNVKDGEAINRGVTTEFNKNQRKKLFIKSSVKGRQFFFDVTDWGDLSLTVKDNGKKVGTTQYLKSRNFVKDKNGDLQSTPSEIVKLLIDKINSDPENKILNLGNFGVSIAQNAPVTDYVSGLVTDLDSTIFRKGQRLLISANSKDVQSIRDKSIILQTPTPTPQEQAQALVNIQNNTIQSSSGLSLTKKEISDLVRAWLLTEEGSLANQTAQESAGKFALEYNKRNSPTEGMTEDDITGTDLFNVVGQGMNVMDAVLSEINNQTLAIEEVKSEARLEEAVLLPNVLEKIKNLTAEIKSTEGLTSKQKREALKNNKKLQALIKQRDELRSANKIVEGPLDINDLESIDDFMMEAERILPDFITIEDINTLKNNLIATGERVGNFVININDIAGGVDVTGKLYTSPSSPFRYHEAFHGVFRMLLTSEQQDTYLKIAKKEKKAELRKEGKSLATELQKFRNSWPTYKNMSQERLEREYFEEYLADKFEQFKQDRRGTQTDSIIKSFFNRLVEIIKFVLGRFKRNELNTLFENIDAGKFRSAPIVNNEFTSGGLGSIVEANKLIPYEAQYQNNEDGIMYIPSLVAEDIIKSMAGILIERKFSFVPSEEVSSFNMEDQMDTVIDQFAEIYDTDEAANQQYLAGSKEKNMLDKLTMAFEGFRNDIKTSINDQIDIIDLQATQQNNNNETIIEDGQVFSSLEDLGGLREISQYGKETYLTGGFDNLSSRLRHYLSTITMPATDYFGNSELLDGTPFVVPVDSNNVYNGILKSLEGLSDPLEMIQKMQLFRSTNAQTDAAITSIFNDAGIIPLTEEGELINELPVELKNPDFFNKVLKAFTNFRVEWYFQQRDNDGNILIHSASQRDDASTQIDLWSQAFTSKLQSWELDPREKTTSIKKLINAKSKLRIDDSSKRIQEKTAIKQASEMSQLIFDAIGIRLSVGYLKFSLLKARDTHYASQKAELKFYPNVNEVLYEDINEIQSLIGSNADIFDKGLEGAASRITKMALNNAVFDETIGGSVFKNTNGDTVNSHQSPTYHLVKTKLLNTQAERSRLKEDPFLANNYLLNSQAFNNLADNNQLKISRVSGTKVLKQIDNNLDPNNKLTLKNMDYGKYTPAEFSLSIINLYLSNLNNLTNGLINPVLVKDEGTGMERTVPTSLVLNRVIESSNTGDLTRLSVIKTMEKVKGKDQITEETIDIFFNFIKNEYDRIVRERSVNETNRNILEYNLVDPLDQDKTPRGFTFANNSSLLDIKTKNSLEQEAQGEPISFQQALKNSNLSVAEFRTQLRGKLNERYLAFFELINSNKAIDGIDNRIKNGLGSRDEATKETASKYNLRQGDPSFNLQQVFFSNYINVKSLNELLLGDQAKTLKDFTNKGKRAKAQNGSGISAYTPFIDKSKNINHATDNINLVTISEPKSISGISNNAIDNADAQMWITTKAFRHFFFGFGMLSQAQADILDKIEAGEKIKWNQINELIDQKGQLNSKKLVYFDGETFLKMSAFVLTPQLTSIKNSDGTFKPKPNKIPLHNLRVRLEALEADTESVSIAVPLSASKMLKQYISPYEELNINEQGFSGDFGNLSAKFMKLQQISPSNKRKITELSQMKTLITNEQNASQKKTISRYNELLAERQQMKYFNKRGLTFTIAEQEAQDFISSKKKQITPNLVLFSKYAVNSLKAGVASSNLIEFFSLDKFNQPKYNLNIPYTVAKFEQLFLTYFSQGVFQEKIAGTSFALVSSFGTKVYRRVFSVDELGVPEKQEVIRESAAERMSGLVVDGRQASDLVGVKIPKEGIVILDRLRYNIKEFDENGKATGNRYSEGMFPAQFKEVYELIGDSNRPMPKAVSDMFSVRVPSQDKHSAMSVKMVDFLPAYYGSSAMFSDELVEISGADFDIDVAYSQRKDFYVEKDKFIEYGNNYDDYVNYVNREVKERGSIYKTAYDSYELQGSLIQDSLTDIEDTNSKKAGLSVESIGALQALSLPVTKQQFNDYVTDKGFAPYEAPINNEILDIRRNLVSNKNMTSGDMIAYTPANLDIIKEAWNTISERAPILKLRNISQEQDIDDSAGQIIAFTNNKGASIGAVVSPNLYLSLIVENKISLQDLGFSIDNNEYTTFGGAQTKDGIRKQDIISSVVTMNTDNAKDYYVARLGLNQHATGMLTNMIAIGVPLTTSLYLLNNSFIQEQYTEIANDNTGNTKGIATRVNDRISELTNNEQTEGIMIAPSEEILIGGVEDMNTLTAKQQLAILEVFSRVNRIKGFTSKLNSVLSLNNGIGGDLIRVQKRMDDIADMEDFNAALNFRPIFEDTYLGNLKDTFTEFVTELLPEVFISRKPRFIELQKNLLDEVNQTALQFNDNITKRITSDLVGYITISNYINDSNLSGNNLDTADLSNNLIYPGPENNTNNIITAVKNLEKLDPGNFFLENYITSLPASARRNFSGINLINANSWRRLNEAQVYDLQSSFNKLYNDLNTRKDAKKIIAYTFVKDGLGLKSGSILEALSPYVLEDYLSSVSSTMSNLDNVNLLPTDVFIENYLSSAANQDLLVIKTNKLSVSDMPRVYRELGPSDPITGNRRSITYIKDKTSGKTPLAGVSDKDIAEMDYENFKELTDTGYTQWLDKDGLANEATYDKANEKGSKSYVSPRIVYSENIVTAERTKGIAQYSNDVITIDKTELIKSFNEKNWTKPRLLKDGSKAKALDINEFKTLAEWQAFVIEHERQHSLYPRRMFDYETSTQQTNEVELNKFKRQNIQSLFDSNSSLSNLGSVEQYNSYLKSVFPNSKVDNFLYHGTDAKFDTFDKSKQNKNTDPNFTSEGFWFARTKEQAEDFGSNIKIVILNQENPYEKSGRINERGFYEYADQVDDVKAAKKAGNDSAILDINEGGLDGDVPVTEHVVFDPNQIHELGTKEDIKGFKDFVSKPTQQTSEAKTIKRNLVELETPITEFEPAVQELFNSVNPTVELYENTVANYEQDLEAELSPSLRKSIEAMLRDVKKSFTISQLTQQASEVELKTTTGAYETEINDRALYAIRGARELKLKGSPIQTAIGFIYGELPLTIELNKKLSPQQKSLDAYNDSKSFADNAIKQEIAERALSNPSFNKIYDGENITIENFDGESAGLDEFRKLGTMEANDKKAASKVKKEAPVMIDDKNLPAVDKQGQYALDLLSRNNPVTSYPKIKAFWNANIENGEYSEQVEAFKSQNDVNTLEDLIDLYDNNQNSFWASPEGMIEQIKKCNL